jgi:hypothetical protein
VQKYTIPRKSAGQKKINRFLQIIAGRVKSQTVRRVQAFGSEDFRFEEIADE